MMKPIWLLCALALTGVGLSAHAQKADEVTFTHYGHACFLITTSNNTRILTDPMKLEGYHIPDSVRPDLITVSHRHIDHDNVSGVSGEPLVFYGVNGPMDRGLEHKLIPIDTQFKDVRIFDIACNHFNPAKSSILNAIFVFEFDSLRVAHLGDFGYVLNAEQKAQIGAIDILMIPVGGNYTLSPVEADSIIAQLRPRMVVLPMHFKTDASPFLAYTVEDFLKDKSNVRRFSGDTFTFDLHNPPKELQFVVLHSSLE
ncbi:MAG: MBL fold metallo-hydrolase [Candidatus Zixiibacteriota bacterium]|nr:MAG: MBL fold metallo-hydrolase [candidate division Zixibacteria bacterium]